VYVYESVRVALSVWLCDRDRDPPLPSSILADLTSAFDELANSRVTTTDPMTGEIGCDFDHFKCMLARHASALAGRSDGGGGKKGKKKKRATTMELERTRSHTKRSHSRGMASAS
jgi:hypothetical protein